MKHYRVDKMAEIQLLDAPREGNEQFQKLDMADYSRKVFSMFEREEELVRLRFKDSSYWCGNGSLWKRRYYFSKGRRLF